MTRPTRAVVDEVIAGWAGNMREGILIAEVRALREEIEEQRAIAAECDHIREQAVADFMAHPMDETDYEGQLRELREAVKGLPNRWRDRRRALYLDEGDGAWDECADDLEAALVKAGGQ